MVVGVQVNLKIMVGLARQTVQDYLMVRGDIMVGIEGGDIMSAQWELSEKQAQYIDDDSNELLIEGSAGSSAKLYLLVVK